MPPYKTAQRLLILKTLVSQSTHPTVQELFDLVKEKSPKISLATVYRNLKFLTDQGEVRELRLNRTVRYDGIMEPHYHFYCRSCGLVEDLEVDDNHALLHWANQQVEHQVKELDLMIKGKCQNC